MPRLDLSWGSGVVLREQIWGWRHEITHQVVNPDIDGLLTACLLHHVKGWPVIGFYDTQRLTDRRRTSFRWTCAPSSGSTSTCAGRGHEA